MKRVLRNPEQWVETRGGREEASKEEQVSEEQLFASSSSSSSSASPAFVALRATVHALTTITHKSNMQLSYSYTRTRLHTNTEDTWKSSGKDILFLMLPLVNAAPTPRGIPFSDPLKTPETFVFH